MNFSELAERRYSVRKFTDKHLEQEVLDKILRAGHLAPTGCNYQPQRILVLNTDESIAKLKGCTKCHFDAPTALLVCYNKDECWTRKYDEKTCGVSDACIVTTHMMLQAADMGIGSTWVMHFDPFAMRETFQIPQNVEPVALLTMGYPAPDATPPAPARRISPHERNRPLRFLLIFRPLRFILCGENFPSSSKKSLDITQNLCYTRYKNTVFQENAYVSHSQKRTNPLNHRTEQGRGILRRSSILDPVGLFQRSL